MGTITPSKLGTHAIIVGGGIAGLSAAAVLARHFENITLFERDQFSDDASVVRTHTPHGAHAHVLLAGGLVALLRLLPELRGWLEELGRKEGDLTQHTRVAFHGKWLPKAWSGIPIRSCTRSEVEHLLRRAASQQSNVVLRDGWKVEALLGDKVVRGVRAQREDKTEEIHGDLVVDATGRASTSLRWIEDAGAGKVEERIVDAGITYTSAWFEAPAIDDDWAAMATLPSFPNEKRMSVACRFGDQRMLCSIVEYGKPKAPESHAAFIDRARALQVPQLHQLLQASKPLSALETYGNTKNRWRRIGELPWFPDGLVLVGDSVCSLNPRYGQGMTTAAMGVELLEQELLAHYNSNGSLRGFAHRYQKRLEQMLRVPWMIAMMEDTPWCAKLSGHTPSLRERTFLAAAQRVLETAFTDVHTYISFMRVAQLLDPPTAMLQPHTLARIARGPTHSPTGNHAPVV